MQLEHSVAVVTGAESGIGRAIAIRFAAEGARVVVAEIAADVSQAASDNARDRASLGVGPAEAAALQELELAVDVAPPLGPIGQVGLRDFRSAQGASDNRGSLRNVLYICCRAVAAAG